MVFAIFHSYSLAIPPSSFTFNMNAINNKAILYHIFRQMCRAATGGVAVIAIMREFPVQHLAFPAITTPRRWSFQLRRIGAARCRTSLCWTPLSASLSSSDSPRSGETPRLAVSDAGRIRPPAGRHPCTCTCSCFESLALIQNIIYQANRSFNTVLEHFVMG